MSQVSWQLSVTMWETGLKKRAPLPPNVLLLHLQEQNIPLGLFSLVQIS